MQSLTIAGKRIEYVRLSPTRRRSGAPVIVLLHEGLGSIAMWRDFPQRVADETGCEALAYSRHGYGGSDPVSEPRQVSYMHDEALQVLPVLLDTLQVHSPILLGHSDGASIALIHAGGARRSVSGVIALAPHVLVEDRSIESIAKAKLAWETTDLPLRLGKYHDHVESTFRGWNDIWLHPDFRSWNIEEYLPPIACPVLAVQGEDDEYGTMEQIRRIEHLVARTDILPLADCRHSPHRDQPEALLTAVSGFVNQILETP